MTLARKRLGANGLAETHLAMPKVSKTTRGVILTLIGGSCWGFSGTCAKFLMDTYALDPLWMVCVRQLCASALFFIYVFVTPENHAKFSELVETRAEGGRALAKLTLTALCMMANSCCYLIAINRTNSATATVLQTLGLVLLMIYACMSAHRAPRKREILGLILALAGTFLLATGGDFGNLAMPLDGLIWGLVTGLSYAFYTAVPAKALKRWGSPLVNAFAMGISGIILALFIRPWENVPALDTMGIIWFGIIIFFGTFLAFALYLQGVKDLGPLRASMLGTSEPIAATVFSVLWLGTAFTPADILGFALIIIMVYLTA